MCGVLYSRDPCLLVRLIYSKHSGCMRNLYAPAYLVRVLLIFAYIWHCLAPEISMMHCTLYLRT